MAAKRSSRRNLSADCAEVHPEDGSDPKDFFRTEKYARKPDRKTQQLCRQVAETLNQVLSGECDDDLLRELQVIAVAPAPDASQLLVMVGPLLTDQLVLPNDALARLELASGQLRSSVAAAISRRRTPKLLFQFHAGPLVAEELP